MALAPEDEAVVDEKLAAQHAEQQYAGDDVGQGGGDAHAGLQRLRALGQHRQQQGDPHHGKGVELAQPRHGDGRKAHPAGHAVVEGVVGPGGDDVPHQAADGPGQEHGPHHDVAHVHARVPGGVHRVADDRDLIAVLGIAHVHVHEHHQHQHDDPPAVYAQHPGQAGRRVELGDNLGAGPALPGAALEPAHQADDDVVHHQGEERLVGVPFCLEKGGDQGPDAAGNRAGQTHDGQQHRPWQPPRPEQGEVGGRNGPGGDLPLRADVPEAHLEAGGDGQRAAQQGHRDLHRLPDGGLFPQSAGKYGAIGGQWVGAGDRDEQRPQQQRQNHGAGPDAPDLPCLHAVPLGQADQRRLLLLHVTRPPFRPDGSSAGRSGPWWRCGRPPRR